MAQPRGWRCHHLQHDLLVVIPVPLVTIGDLVGQGNGIETWGGSEGILIRVDILKLLDWRLLEASKAGGTEVKTAAWMVLR